jgi:hypothetical protein
MILDRMAHAETRRRGREGGVLSASPRLRVRPAVMEVHTESVEME